MARRRKYQKRVGLLERMREMDWSTEPETRKAVVAITFLVLGALLLMSFFGSAGKLGETLSVWTRYVFGFPGYIVPIVLLFLGGGLILGKFSLKPLQVLSIILLFILMPSLFYPDGGFIGDKIVPLFRGLLGAYAAFLIILGFNFIFILVASNTSIERIINFFWTRAEEDIDRSNVKVNQKRISVFTTVKKKIGFGGIPKQIAEAPPKKIIEVKRDINWHFPPIDLLQTSDTEASPGNINHNVEIIQKTLKDFNIEVAMSNVNVGPTVTQYTLKPAEGVKLSNIIARTNDLSLSLAAPHPIRIEAPIPGKSAVGIEVPNRQKAIVTLRELLESNEYKKDHSSLAIAMGRDVSGGPLIAVLEKMPHLLIAGATGSGKSISLNSIIISFLYQNSPSELKLILVDPKRVEFTHYNGIPHLLTPVITEVDKTISALKWVTAEMDRRFKLFSASQHRNIQEYNNDKDRERMPFIVVVIDELADLMAQAANEVEGAIVRLAQMARATGIHLIVATQRPSVNVITGLIKANITSRMAFAVASQIDSRTIIDMSGAEKLLGNGDMLYISNEVGKPRRVQGCFVSTKEVERVTDFLRKEAPDIKYNEEIINFKIERGKMAGDMTIDDDLYGEAKELVVRSGRASASLLQRRLRIGYARAARLLDLLEAEGVISSADGTNRPRDILVSENSDMSSNAYAYEESTPVEESYQNRIN